jgi:hypothetical protein
MADQLLSQADVDALVSSLTRSEPAKPVTPAAPPAKSTAASAGPKLAGLPVSKNQPSQAKAVQPSVMTASPAAKAAQPSVMTSPAAKAAQPVRQERKAEVSVDMINTMNAKIADLTNKLTQMGTALKRIEILEKKATELEKTVAKNKEAPETAQRVVELSEAVKKISTNLKGTPGYGVRHTFNCEKCSDQGHVAVMYRCTKCGHERWYGWWPDKK